MNLNIHYHINNEYSISMNIKIIKSDISNWREFRKIRLESLRCEPEAFTSSLKKTEEYSDEYWIDMVSDINNIVLLAFVDKTVVGIIRAALIDEDVKEGTAFIGSFYVNINYRKQGIGKLLMDELINRIKENSEIYAVRLWVGIKQFDAINFYESYGFKKVNEEIKDGKKELVFEKIIR